VLIRRSAIRVHQDERISAPELAKMYASVVPRFYESILDSNTTFAFHDHLTFSAMFLNKIATRTCALTALARQRPSLRAATARALYASS
jgi:hypothetical protein